jgi:hypothetical protein
LFDWFSWGMGIFQGVIVAIIGGTIVLVYIFPRLTDKVANNVLKSLRSDPEFKAVFAKSRELVSKAEPALEQFKKLDAEKIVKEIEPFLTMIKRIDPQKVNDILDGAKKMVDTFATKPVIPVPPPKIDQENQKEDNYD